MSAKAESEQRAGAGNLRRLARGVVTLLVILVAYAPVWRAGFIWDDDAHVTTNPVIIGPLGLKEIWTSAKANYFPLTMTSFWVQHALWGLSPAPFHIVNVLFHGACAITLWLVLRRLQVPGAWFAAMVWALHPVQVESAAWISELKNTQSGFFFLLAVLFFLRWMQREGPLRANRDYVLTIVAAVLAVLSKSSTVMLPVVLVLLGWWLGRRQWRDLLWLAPLFALSAMAGGWTIWEQKVNSMAAGPDWAHGLAPRFVIAGKVFWFYLGKLAWPHPLIFIYPRWSVTQVSSAAWLPLLAAVVAAGVLWWRRDRELRPVFLGIGYFALSLFPVLGLFDVFFFRYSFVGDHLQYLASMGPLTMLGAGIAVALARATPTAAWIKCGVTLVLLLLLGCLTWQQSRIYQTNRRLWEVTARLNPNAWIARVNFGSELMSAGEPARALAEFEAAMRLRPAAKEVAVNVGNALLGVNRPADAIVEFEKALQTTLARPEAHNGIGVALGALGRLPEAIPHYEAAIRLKPDFVAAYLNLGAAYYNAGRKADAMGTWQVALKRDSTNAQLWGNLGAALFDLRRLPESIAASTEAIRLAPTVVDFRCNLALALHEAGRTAEAIQQVDVALKLQPDSARARDFRAQFQAALERTRTPR